MLKMGLAKCIVEMKITFTAPLAANRHLIVFIGAWSCRCSMVQFYVKKI
jgi:hypothetical protein